MGFERWVVGPPQRDRQVVDEQRDDDRSQMQAGLAASPYEDRLGTRLSPAGGRREGEGFDVCLQAGLALRIRGREDQRARRVAAGRAGDDGRAALRGCLVSCEDDEIQHARAGDDVIGRPGTDPGLLGRGQGSRKRGCRASCSFGLSGDGRSLGFGGRGLGRRGPSPQLAQLALYLGQGVRHGPRRCQILRHRRPSRSISSSPSSGPQDPAA